MALKICFFMTIFKVIPIVMNQKMSDAVKQDLMTPMRELGEGCGYEGCPITKKDALNVHIVAHSHGELGFSQTFHEHYTGVMDETHVKSLVNWKRILDAVITELWNHRHRKFTLADTPYFFHWWSNRDGTVHRMVYELIRQGRLHIVGGGWGLVDESCTSYHAIIDQFTHSLRKLNKTLGPCGRPLVAWQADTFGHSREFTNLASMLAFDGLFINPISYEDEIFRMHKKELEMLWRGSDDLGPASDIFTHKLFDGFWPPPGFCFGTGCNDTLIITSDSQFRNVQERVNTFLNSVLHRQGTHYATNHIMVVMGMTMGYYDAPMWFNNIDTLISKIFERVDSDVHAIYSAPACYLKAVHDSTPSLPIKQDDFMPITYDKTTHLTGLFTSRPTIKYMAREGHLFLQIAKQLFVLAQLPSSDKKLYDDLTWVAAAFQDHGIITGGMLSHVKNYYTEKMYFGVQKSTLVVKKAFNKLRKSPADTTYYRCSFNVSSCKNTNALRSFVVIYNPLGWPVTVPVRIPVAHSTRHVVYDPKLQSVKAVSMKISAAVLNIPQRDPADYELVFMADRLPPMGYRSYYIESTAAHQKAKRSIIKNLRNSKKKMYLSRQTDHMKIDDDFILDYEQDEDYYEETTPVMEYANETYYEDIKGPLYKTPDKGDRYLEVISDEEEAKYKALFGRKELSEESEEEESITENPRINEKYFKKPSKWKKRWGLSKHKASVKNLEALNKKHNSEPNHSYKAIKKPYPNFFSNKHSSSKPEDMGKADHGPSRTQNAYVLAPENANLHIPSKIYVSHPPIESAGIEKYNFKSLDAQKDNSKSLNYQETQRSHKDELNTLSNLEKDLKTLNSKNNDIKTLKRFTSDKEFDKKKRFRHKYMNKSFTKESGYKWAKNVEDLDVAETKLPSEESGSTATPESGSTATPESDSDFEDIFNPPHQKKHLKPDAQPKVRSYQKQSEVVSETVSGTLSDAGSTASPESDSGFADFFIPPHQKNHQKPEAQLETVSRTSPDSDSTAPPDSDSGFADFFRPPHKKKHQKPDTQPELNSKVLPATVSGSLPDTGSKDPPDSDSGFPEFFRPPHQKKHQTPTTQKEGQRRLFETSHVKPTRVPGEIRTTTEYDPLKDPDFDEENNYLYKVSKDKFIKNKYIKVHLADHNQVVRVSLSNGVEVALTIGLYYYASDDPEKMGREEKKPSPYVFKVMDPEPVIIQDYVKSAVHKTYLVEEVQYSLSSWAGFVLRVYAERPLIELDWVVGPVPIADNIGKDVFIRYHTDLASAGVFYTDSNGRQTVKRVRSTRPTFKPALNNIPSNIYPVTSKIYIEDPEKNIRFSVFNDRAQGGTSLHDGEIDLMLHRRILTDERDLDANFGIPLIAPLNETEFGQGIVVRGKHIIYISKADYKHNKIFEKKLAKELELAPTVFVSPYNAYGVNTKDMWAKENNEFRGIIGHLPAGVHVLTLQEWDGNNLLLRLENYLEKADAVKAGVKTVFIKDLFANITIKSVKETTLGGNVWAKDWIPFQWNTKEKFVKNFNEFYHGNGKVQYADQDARSYTEANFTAGITLVPQEIRTFVVSYEYHS